MTQPTETPRCQVAVWERAQSVAYCGRPLEPTGGPCVTCGHHRSVHGRITGVCMKCSEVRMSDTFPKPDDEHPYVSPQACPVHGAATDRGEA